MKDLLKSAVTGKEARKDAGICFIIPKVNAEVASFIEVSHCVNVADLRLIQHGTLVSFDNLRLLKLVSEFPDVFECEIVVMVGYPEAEYGTTFDQLTWNFQKVSFDQTVGDLAADRQLEAIKAGQPKRRSDGTKVPNDPAAKKFKSFDRVNASGGLTSESADDETEFQV